VTELLVPERSSPHPSAAVRPRAPWRLLRRHAALVVLLAAALALRALALVAIYPGIWFSDSNTYVDAAATGVLSVDRVMGYALFVAPFWQAGSAGALVVAQHLLGVGLVVALYALLVRRGAGRLLALLAVVPAALDAYLVHVEHTIMSETVFHAALVAALVLLLWPERVGAVAAAGAGVLLGYAAVVRSVAVPFVAIVALYLLVRRAGWRPLAALCVGWAVVAGGYAGLFAVQHGRFGFTESDGRFLYARTAPFADCARLGDLPAGERRLCPDPRRRMTTNWYLWGASSPIAGLPPAANPRIRDFARRVVVHQPLDYARVVAGGVLHYFEPGHRIGANDYPVAAWQFPRDPRRWGYPGYRGPIRAGDPQRHRRHPITEPGPNVARMANGPARLDAGASRALHDYQRVVYGHGPLLGACLLVVAVALVRRGGPGRLRLDAALLALLVLTGLAVAQALSVFSYRYGLLAALLLPVAAGMAGASLARPRPAIRR
jgi:hypothetical protein